MALPNLWFWRRDNIDIADRNILKKIPLFGASEHHTGMCRFLVYLTTDTYIYG